MWIHPKSIHYIFTVKGCTMPIAAFCLFGWCIANGGGLKAMDLASSAGELSSSVTPLGWSVMAGINSIFGSLSPMLVNQPDLARYCKKPRDAGITQGISVFVSSIVVFFLGIALQLDTSWVVFVIGRVVAGLGVGIISCLVPMYQSECAPKKIRGTIVGLYQFASTSFYFLHS